MSANPPAGVWGHPEIEVAARRILDAGLGEGQSVIEPDMPAWRPDVAADMRRRVVDNFDAGSGTFLDKLRVQLNGAPRATYLLSAELLYIQVAPLANVTGDTKKRRIRSVLSWLQPSAQLPPDLDAALAVPGVFRGGVGFNVQIWRQVGWLLSFVEHWWRQPDDDRATALTDPWMFRQIVAAMPVDHPGIRNALLWRQEGFVSLAATHLGEVPPNADRQQVRAAVEAGYQHVEYAQRLALATEDLLGASDRRAPH